MREFEVYGVCFFAEGPDTETAVAQLWVGSLEQRHVDELHHDLLTGTGRYVEIAAQVCEPRGITLHPA